MLYTSIYWINVMAAKIATNLNGEPLNEDEGKTRKVYVVQRKEVVSYEYYVIANSQNEALEIFENESYDDWDSDLENEDSSGVYRIDGTFTFHREMKPTIEKMFKQELKVKKSEFRNYASLKWQDMEGESRW